LKEPGGNWLWIVLDIREPYRDRDRGRDRDGYRDRRLNKKQNVLRGNMLTKIAHKMLRDLEVLLGTMVTTHIHTHTETWLTPHGWAFK